MNIKLNLADKISVFRIILVPIIFVLMLLGYYLRLHIVVMISKSYNYHFNIFLIIAGLVFIIAALSDILDGFVARRKKIVSNQGKFLDAIADKILCNMVIITFLWMSVINIYIAIILVLRDFLVDTLRLISKKNNVVIGANWIGKLKTLIIMIGLSILFYFNNLSVLTSSEKPFCPWYIQQFLLVLMYLGCVFSLLSAVIYFYSNFKYLKNDKIKIVKNDL